jgi:ribonuclease BN (tRNA processing enzyme)
MAETTADRVILLGTRGGPALRPGGSWPTSNLLIAGGVPYVVDCGLGVTRGFVESGLQLTTLSHVFITHHHSDHNLEFGNLVYTAWVTGLSTPVKCYGPTGLASMADDFCKLNRFDIETRIVDEGRPPFRPLMQVTDYAEGLLMDDGRMRVTALRNHHPPVTDSFSLKFEFAGKTVVFGADTAYLPALAEFARGADVLIHEVMYGPRVDALVARVKNGARLKEHLLASHTLTEDVGRIAAAAGVKRLVLNHLVPGDDAAITSDDWARSVGTHWAGPLDVGRDGLTIPV